jgi:hypothetical protein
MKIRSRLETDVREAVASIILPKLRWRRICLNFLLAESLFFDKIRKPMQTMQVFSINPIGIRFRRQLAHFHCVQLTRPAC